MRAKEFIFEYKRDITAQRLGTKLVQSGQKEGVTDVNEILAALEEMDPTPNKQYMMWLANQYIASNFRLEDERIRDLLTWFHANKSKLDQKDIGRYDISSLGDTYSKYNQQVFSADKQEEEKARRESEIIDDSDLGILVIPKTEFAAQYWGRGTNWCTAYGDPKGKWPERTSQFEIYSKPLYIWIDKTDGEKYQFHLSTGQYMDKNDRKLSDEKLEYFFTKHPVVKKLVPISIMQGFQQLWKYAPDKMFTPEGFLAVVKQSGKALAYAPEKLLTPEICLAAVTQYGRALQYVPEKLRTPEICLAAVTQYGSALELVPEELRTPEICLIAVTQDGWALQYVPEELRTPEICLAAVKQNGRALTLVPEELITPQLSLIAVKKSGGAILSVPRNLRTSEILLTAVKQDGSALAYVTNNLLTPEICLAAVTQDGWALQYVPEELRTPEICLAAVKQNRGVLSYVPTRLRDRISSEAGLT